MLTGREMAQLFKLQKRAAETVAPITEKELTEMEKAVEQVFANNIDTYTAIINAWNLYCDELKKLATQNARLIMEVRRLNSTLCQP